MFIAVSPTLGVSTLPQLIALAKKEPGTISIAATGVGRLTHLTGLVLQERAGIQLLPVPYNGGPAAALADVGERPGVDDHRGLFGDRWGGESRTSEADRGRSA